MRPLHLSFAVLLAITFTASTARAAFIVEAVGGKASTNFSSTGHTTSTTPSTAVGLTSPTSIFGNPNAEPDVYTFSYTPGTDADNTTFAPGDALGNSSAVDADGSGVLAPVYVTAPQLATGLTGGESGVYNVYFTAPPSINVNAAGSLFEITGDLGTVALNPVNLNNTGTGPDEDPGTTFAGGANSRWLHVGTVSLTAGNTYTLTLTANAATFVSQRAHGVMWELVAPIPEPSLFGMMGVAAAGLVLRRRRRA